MRVVLHQEEGECMLVAGSTAAGEGRLGRVGATGVSRHVLISLPMHDLPPRCCSLRADHVFAAEQRRLAMFTAVLYTVNR
jgi:hypothetical protein